MGVNFKNAKSKLDWYAQPADLNRQKEALGESVDTDDDLDFDDTNGGIDPIDDPIDDPTDSTTRMPDEPVFDDEVSDIQTEKVEGGVARHPRLRSTPMAWLRSNGQSYQVDHV